ncbi:MAG TPA: two-component regulator propeller domain-containing protein [Pyrinomonadaceae bacterium]|nr:two-component regulator propeller domain-containing protein [Pyrinomonadaceae bacterium]
MCCCLCVISTAVRAQYRIDQWTADDGLPQNSVYGIVQTKDGYLWLATVDGLARFDGARFTVFNKSNSAGIVNNRFLNLFESADGDLWAGTEESGAVRYQGGRFEHFRAEVGFPESVVWIESDTSGDGEIIHAYDRTVRFTGRKGSPFEPDANIPLPAGAARSSSVKIFCRFNGENKFSECFINGRWQSFSLPDRLSEGKFLSVALELNTDGSPKLRFVPTAAQASNGIAWLITADGRIAEAENGRVTRFFDGRDGLPKYPLYFITGARLALVAKDEEGALWLVDLPSMQKELLLRKDAVPPPLLKSAETFSTYADGEGDLWFGTSRDGLFRARKQIVTPYSEAEGIAKKTVYPVYQDRAGTIWGGSDGLYKNENGRFVFIESTANFLVNAIGEDGAGRLLISNFGALYVRDNNEFVPFEPGKIPAIGLIFAIHADRENALWIGGDGGLRRFKDGVLKSFTTADGLAGNNVKTIIEAKSGGLWIGTYDGLSRFENGRLQSWREADGLPSRTVRALYEDADGALWIGSYDGGLARFKNGQFTRYNTKTGLPNDGAFQILEDDDRNFWISSNRGIYRVKRDELNDFADGRIARVNAVAYGKSDGMLNAECNGGRSPAGVRARDGRLWFPTQDGLAVIDPQNIKTNSQPPPVVIETIKIDNNEAEFDKQRSEINIEPAQQNFEIAYTALSFINSENLRFKYKLEGLDDDWIDAGTRRLAYFSHVPPGDYTFRVIAANSDGVWNERGATLKITVSPPFYRTWWFLSLSVFSLFGLAFFIYRRRISRLQRAKKDQESFSRRLIESQENERKRIAGELHDSLSQNLVIIKNRAMMSLAERDNVGYAFEQIEEIAEAATESLAEVREIAANLRPFQIDRLGLTKAVRALIRKTTAPNLKIASRIDEIDAVLPPEMQINLYRILQESLNNIIKHSKATEAEVLIEKNGKIISVEISDNGIGFDKSARLEENEVGGGFGLSGMSERARILGATLIVESSAGNGVTVSFRINCQHP